MNTRYLYVSVMLLILLLLPVSHASADTPTAKQILEKMANAYTNCKSYRDSGVVKSQTEASKGGKVQNQKKEEINFTTAFVRPDRFRFEFKISPGKGLYNSGIVWKQESKVRDWPDLLQLLRSKQHKPQSIETTQKTQKQLEKQAEQRDLFGRPLTLLTALAQATGTSSGAANTIPRLLLPGETKGFQLLTHMTEIKRATDTRQDDRDCFCITGLKVVSELDMRTHVSIWIDKETFLVRRIEEKSRWQFAGLNFVKEQTTTYVPEIDSDIPESMLLFNPPTPPPTPAKPPAS